MESTWRECLSSSSASASRSDHSSQSPFSILLSSLSVGRVSFLNCLFVFCVALWLCIFSISLCSLPNCPCRLLFVDLSPSTFTSCSSLSPFPFCFPPIPHSGPCRLNTQPPNHVLSSIGLSSRPLPRLNPVFILSAADRVRPRPALPPSPAAATQQDDCQSTLTCHLSSPTYHGQEGKGCSTASPG